MPNPELQSVFVPDSNPLTVLLFGTSEQIVACQSNADIAYGYSHDGRIFQHWRQRGPDGWIEILTKPVTMASLAQDAAEVTRKDEAAQAALDAELAAQKAAQTPPVTVDALKVALTNVLTPAG